MTLVVPASYSAKNALSQRTPVYTLEIAGNATIFSTHALHDYLTEVLADAPSAYWRLGEASGTSAADSSGNGMVGTYVNLPTLGAEGALAGDSDTAVTLDGGAQYITVPDNALLDPGDVFTLEAWVKAANLAANVAILSKNTNGYVVLIEATTGQIIIQKDSIQTIANSTAGIVAGVYYHVVWTKNGAANLIYINGVDVTGALTNATIVATADPLQIGRRGTSNYFPGSIDEVAIYPTALSAARVKAHYEAGIGLYKLSGVSAIMQPPHGIASQIDLHRGRSSVSSVSLVLLDDNGEITDLIADGIGNEIATIRAGFLDIPYGDFVTVHTGPIENYKLTSDLGSYELTVRDPTALANRQVFNPAFSPLSVSLTNIYTASAIVASTNDFQAAGHVRIDDEIIKYDSKGAGIQIAEKQWKSIAFGAGVYVAVSTDGAVATSPDAVDWTARTPAAANAWQGVCWSSALTLFVAVASTGTNRVMTSPDGITWTARTAANQYAWSSVAWSPALGLFAAVVGGVGHSVSGGFITQTVMTSADGITWTSRAAYIKSNFIVWSADIGTFTTGGLVSTDGITWASNWQIPSGYAWTSVAWSSTLGLYAAVSGNSFTAATSPDGITWTLRYTSGGAGLSSIVWAAGLTLFVSAGLDGLYLTSPDGITWTLRHAGNGYVWRSITWSPSLALLVAVSSDARIMTSTDGTSWTLRTSPTTAGGAAIGWWSVVWSPDIPLFVAVALFNGDGSTGLVATSADGITWTRRTAAAVKNWISVAWAPSLTLFAAVASNGTSTDVMTSPDGITWTSRTPAANVSWTAVMWSPALSLFIAVAQTGTAAQRIMTSANGTAWTSRTAPVDQQWACLATDGTAVIALGNNGSDAIYQMSSTNGTSWAATVRIEPNTWEGGAWSPSLALFVAVAADGTNRAASSTNGITFTPRTASAANAWRSVAWSAGLSIFAAVASDGTDRAMSSTNGTSWTARTAASQNQWKAVAENSSLFVAVSSTGSGDRAMKSVNGTAWTKVTSGLITLTRAQHGTVAAAHSVGATVRQVFHLGPDHPLDILQSVLMNTDATGLSLDAAMVNSTAIDAVKAALGSSYEMEFWIHESTNAKSWIEDEICAPLGCSLVISGDGRISIRQTLVPSVADDTITHDDILADGNGKPVMSFDGNFRSSLLNKVIVKIDYDDLTGEFGKILTFTADSSIDDYGEAPIVFESRGFHSTLTGTETLINEIAAAILMRYSNGAPLVTMRTFLQKHLLEPGDIVGVTSALLPNPAGGGRGVTDALMEVINRQVNFADGNVGLTLLWTSWSS